ncbi:MAG: phosphatidate cytidylyltransferase [Spirochaetales bacterium]|nr:phosphatidate cytidylyltransferase [Spirochaetales bacterium]
MNKLLKRLLLVAIIFPTIYLCLFVFTFQSHLLFNVLIAVFAFGSAFEMAGILKKAQFEVMQWLSPVLSALLPIIAYVNYAFYPDLDLVHLFLILSFIIVFLKILFPLNNKDFSKTIKSLASSVLVIVYPGYFFTYMVKILSLESPHWSFLLYLLIVFANEIFAYLIGNFMGRKSKLNLPVSPNKSIAGFVGGSVAAIVFPLVFYVIPGFLTIEPWVFVLFCLFLSVIANLGDLIESAIKRSAAIKDSGNSLAGRGGFFDSVDGLLLSAPFYYWLFQFLKG